jgi:hypothetical protein
MTQELLELEFNYFYISQIAPYNVCGSVSYVGRSLYWAFVDFNYLFYTIVASSQCQYLEYF